MGAEEQVRAYIEKLRQAILAAIEDEDFGQAANWCEIAAGLDRWLKQGMPGRMPLDKATLAEVEQAQFRRARLRTIARLRRLVQDDLSYPDTPPSLSDNLAVGLSGSLRRQILLEIWRLSDELARAFPQDGDAGRWKDWQREVQIALGRLPVEEAPAEAATKRAEPRLPQSIVRVFSRPRWLLVLIALVVFALITGIVVLACIGLPRWFAGLLAGATATPVAVLPTAIPTRFSPVPIPTRFSPTPLPLPSLAPTITMVPSPLLVNVAFPEAEGSYPTFPWQILVTSTRPATLSLWLDAYPAITMPITVTLFGGRARICTHTLLLTETWPLKPEVVGGEYILRWTRGVDDLRELPDGRYRLWIEGTGEAGQPIRNSPVEFSINRTESVSVVVALGPLRLRVFPWAGSAHRGWLADGTSVRVLGQVGYVDGAGNLVVANEYGFVDRWCHIEVADGRRGWTWCVLLGPTAEVAWIAPPLPVRLYATGGR